jgi:hypothetical protein
MLCALLQSIGLSQYAAIFAKVCQCDIAYLMTSMVVLQIQKLFSTAFHGFLPAFQHVSLVVLLLRAHIPLVLTGRD